MMELPKIKHSQMEKFSPLKYKHHFPTRDGLLLKSLQNENLFIKQKLAEFESRLSLMPVALSYDKFQSQSINVKNENKIELPKPRKVKSARPTIAKRIDAFLNHQNVNETINETNEKGIDIKEDISEDFKIPQKSFSRLNSARSNFSRVSTARNDFTEDLIPRLKSAQVVSQPKSARSKSARSKSDLSSRLNSARTAETYSTALNSEQTENSALAKMDVVLDNLKKHRRSARRSLLIEETIKPRPKTTNPLINPVEVNVNESSKKKSRSKSSRKSAKKDEYKHMFYSNSWRIHSEFIKEEPDRTAPWDNTTSLFYKTKRKMPETFIFAPDWI